MINTLLYLAVVVSFIPVIAWVGGLIGLLYLLFFIYHNFINKNQKLELLVSFQRKWNHLAWIAFIMGIVVFSIAKVHSTILINELRNESKEASREFLKPVDQSENGEEGKKTQ